MSLSDEQAKFLQHVILLVQFAVQLGFKVTPGELARTIEQQKIYVQTGRSKTLNSMHLKKLAIDLNFFLHGKYINNLPQYETLKILKPIGKFWESLDPKNRWGGNFDKDFTRSDPWVDTPHFERFV